MFGTARMDGQPIALAVIVLVALASDGVMSSAVAQVNVDPPIVPEDAQTPFRFIGLAADPQPIDCTAATPWCPAANGWVGTDLFGSSPPPGLQRFCLYESDTGIQPDLDVLVAQGCLTQLDADVMAVTPYATPQPFEALVWPALSDNFLRQGGQLPPAAAPTEALVRLSILDTQPTQQLQGPGNALHGFTLTKMAERLICTGPDRCGVDIRTRLALPYTDFCRTCTDPKGGFFGTIGALASAIRAEVADWDQANMTQSRRLVLNLSVGWDPRYGRFSFARPTPLPVLAVLRALQDASCRGALTIAAAGNRLSGPENTPGPLLPGGWEDLPAPSFNYCRLNLEADRVDENDFPTEPTYRPLVYGAGAVSFDNAAIDGRVLGEPPRTAYGAYAVVDALINGTVGPTETQTGTSVGALVVSAAAAASWHYHTDTPAFALMLDVDASGQDLQRKAQYCLPPGPAPCDLPVRRISVCDAVAASCEGNEGGLCPPPGTFSCKPPPAEPPELPFVEIDTLFEDPAVPVVDIAELTRLTFLPEGCGTWVLRSHPEDVVDDPCPHRQYYAMQATPWTNPQPSSQPCPTCTAEFRSPGRLYLEIADEYGGDVTDVTLVCGNLGLRLPDDTQPLSADNRYLVTGIPEFCAPRLQIAYRVFNTGPDPEVSALTRVLVYTAPQAP
jgi:hypothetical protein